MNSIIDLTGLTNVTLNVNINMNVNSEQKSNPTSVKKPIEHTNDPINNIPSLIDKDFAEFKEYLSTKIDDIQFMRERSDHASKILAMFERDVCKRALRLKLEFNDKFSSRAGSFSVERIRLSSKILVTWDRLKETLLHELCHAATVMVSHVNDHHGPVFQHWANICKSKLGVNITTRHSYEIEFKHVFKCTSASCGKTHSRNRSFNLKRFKCACGGEIKKIK